MEMEKNADFYCSECDFVCSKMSEWKRHVKTKKHIYRHNGNNISKMEIKKNAEYTCNCGKKYSSNSGLWKHSKSCKSQNCDDTFLTMDQLPKDFKITTQMFYDLLKQNNELQKNIIDLIKEKGPNNTNTNTNITNNEKQITKGNQNHASILKAF